MKYAIFGCVGGYDLIDGIINTVSNSLKENISHTFTILPIIDSDLYKVFEAKGQATEKDPYPGFFAHDLETYKDNELARFIVMEVTDDDYYNGVKYANDLLGRFYGYITCIKGGIYELFGKKIPDTDIFVNCSEAQSRIARKMGIDILPELEAGSIVPDESIKALISCGGRFITWEEVLECIQKNK